MTADRPELSAGIAALTTEVVALNEGLKQTTKSVDYLAKSTKKLGEKSRTHSKWIFGTVATIVVDVLVTIVVWLLFDQQSELIRQQQETTDRLKISIQESCNLYALFLGSYRPESRPPGQDRETYEDNFRQLRESYQVLKCTERIVPPAIQPRPTPTALPGPPR